MPLGNQVYQDQQNTDQCIINKKQNTQNTPNTKSSYFLIFKWNIDLYDPSKWQFLAGGLVKIGLNGKICIFRKTGYYIMIFNLNTLTDKIYQIKMFR